MADPFPRSIWVTVLALLVLGCATRAHTDFDPNAPFDRYQSFAWLRSPEQQSEELRDEADPLLLRRIRTAIEQGLVAKGYRKRDTVEGADFVVSFSLGSRERIEQSQVRVGTGWSGHYGGWWASVPVATQTHTEGTLSIDIFDGASREAVWHGRASRRVTPRMDRVALVNDVVGAILAKFPPPR